MGWGSEKWDTPWGHLRGALHGAKKGHSMGPLKRDTPGVALDVRSSMDEAATEKRAILKGRRDAQEAAIVVISLGYFQCVDNLVRGSHSIPTLTGRPKTQNTIETGNILSIDKILPSLSVLYI